MTGERGLPGLPSSVCVCAVQLEPSLSTQQLPALCNGSVDSIFESTYMSVDKERAAALLDFFNNFLFIVIYFIYYYFILIFFARALMALVFSEIATAFGIRSIW